MEEEIEIEVLVANHPTETIHDAWVFSTTNVTFVGLGNSTITIHIYILNVARMQNGSTHTILCRNTIL